LLVCKAQWVTCTTSASPGTLHLSPLCRLLGRESPRPQKSPVEETESSSWQQAPLPKRPESPQRSWLSPAEANRTSLIYPRPRSGLRICCYLCVQSDSWALDEENCSPLEVVPGIKRALWNMAELFVLLYTGASCSNVAIPVLLKTIRNRNPFNLLFAFPNNHLWLTSTS